MPERVTIEETGVDEPLSITLEEEDLPTAEEYGESAFETGGKLIKERIDLPGRENAPIYHVLVAPERPFVIKGAFRDWLRGGDGHARAMERKLLQIYRRANLLRITVGDEERTGILDEPKFGRESDNSITYELTFDIAVPADASVTEPADREEQPEADIAAALAERLAERQAAVEATAARAGAVRVMDAAISAGRAVGTAVAAVQSAAE